MKTLLISTVLLSLSKHPTLEGFQTLRGFIHLPHFFSTLYPRGKKKNNSKTNCPAEPVEASLQTTTETFLSLPSCSSLKLVPQSQSHLKSSVLLEEFGEGKGFKANQTKSK